MHNSGRQSRQKLKQQSFIALSRPQVATKTPPMGAVGACQSVYWRGAGLTLDWR